jgi:hypothetical protein
VRRARLATHRDDAPPEWHWFWDRLAGAWVPGLDGYVAVGMTGPRRVEFNVRTNITEYYGADGSIEIQRNRVRYALNVPPLLLREVTMIHYGWLRASGNRSATLCGISDGTNQNVMEWSGSAAEFRRALTPPGAFDGTGIFPSTGAFYQSLASVKTGDQRYYVNGTAGSSYSSSSSPSYASLVYGECGSTDGALEFYWRHRLSCVLLGTTTAAEVKRFDGVGQTLAPFIWKRRRSYFIAGGAPPAFTARGLWFTR